MKQVPITLKKLNSDALDYAHFISEIVSCLQNQGIVLLPTDTVYGLAVMPHLQKPVERLYALKNRPSSMPLPIMVASSEALMRIGFDLSEQALNLLRSPLIPGSITLAMGFKAGKRLDWLEDRQEAAVRIPNEGYLLDVLKKTGPLLVTSANVHGTETPDNVSEILAQLNGELELVIDGGKLKTIPSTLVNCRLTPPVIERLGVISQEMVMQYLI